MANPIEHVHRVAWQPDFPDVITWMSITDRDMNANYLPAKYFKNQKCAEKLLDDIKGTPQYESAIEKLSVFGRDVILVPVHSLEHGYNPKTKKAAVGSNPIPLELALMASDVMGWKINNNIVQSNIVGRTGTDCISRFTNPPMFSGEIEAGKKYIIIDDHISMGATAANCRGHIEKQGGHVVAISTLTGSRSGMCIRLTSRNLNRMTKSENFATIGCHSGITEKVFGYGLECFTNEEASQFLYLMEDAKRINPHYCMQNFFDNIIKHRLYAGHKPKNKAELGIEVQSRDSKPIQASSYTLLHNALR